MNKAFEQILLTLNRWRLTAWIVRFFLERLTLKGRLLLFLAFVAINQTGGKELYGISHPTYFITSFIAAMLLISVVAGFFAVPKLKLSRKNLSYTSAGENLFFEVEVENISKRCIYNLSIRELNLPQSMSLVKESCSTEISCLAPKEKVSFQLVLKCKKRGAYTLKELTAVSSFPFGLWNGVYRVKEDASFLVYPAYTKLEAFPVPQGRHYQPGGFLVSSNVGESPEFMGTREYRSGDNLRHIHWASWARTGKPIVKTYHEEYFVRLALVVDSEVPSKTADEAFEACVSLAAGIAENLSRQDYIIDIFAAGSTVYHFQSGRALAHFENILQVLSCIDSATIIDWQALSSAILPESPKLTGVVAIFTDWTIEREKFIGELVSLGVGVRVIVIHKGSTKLSTSQTPTTDFIQIAPGEKILC